MGRVAGLSMVRYAHKQNPAGAMDGFTLDEIYNPIASEWFNSAKFLDIEHQLYGEVPSSVEPNTDLLSLYWSDLANRQSIRITYKEGKVVGLCTLGIRLRQSQCERIIRERYSVDQTLESLDLLRFDEEFDDTLLRAKESLKSQFQADYP